MTGFFFFSKLAFSCFYSWKGVSFLGPIIPPSPVTPFKRLRPFLGMSFRGETSLTTITGWSFRCCSWTEWLSAGPSHFLGLLPVATREYGGIAFRECPNSPAPQSWHALRWQGFSASLPVNHDGTWHICIHRLQREPVTAGTLKD